MMGHRMKAIQFLFAFIRSCRREKIRVGDLWRCNIWIQGKQTEWMLKINKDLDEIVKQQEKRRNCKK
jgi:hypothetical protein